MWSRTKQMWVCYSSIDFHGSCKRQPSGLYFQSISIEKLSGKLHNKELTGILNWSLDNLLSENMSYNLGQLETFWISYMGLPQGSTTILSVPREWFFLFPLNSKLPSDKVVRIQYHFILIAHGNMYTLQTASLEIVVGVKPFQNYF